MGEPGSLKKGAFMSASYDTALQVGLRIVSFVLNAFIVRQVSREVFAVMTVRLYLLYATGLLLSREAFRRATLSSKGSRDFTKIINLIWMGSVIGIAVCYCGWYTWCHIMELPPAAVTPDYHAGVLLMVASVMIELTAEVPFILAELQMWYKAKVVIEGQMQLIRSVLLAALVYLQPESSVLMYGVSHVVGSLLYCTAYYGLFAIIFSNKEQTKKLPVHSIRQLFPSRKEGHLLPEVDPELAALSWSFFKQGWIKEALTEGELYMMNFFPLISLAQQGVYQVVSNLGSLAARLIFKSIETAAYKYFAQMLHRGKPIKEQDKTVVGEVVGFLAVLLHNLVLFSLIIITFGWSYSNLLLRMYGGAQLSEGPGTTLMRAQCVYVIFLALNGVTEAYTFAAMTDQQLSRYNRLLVLFSAVYIAAAVTSTHVMGALGFVLANCINMGLRISYSLWYIYKQYYGSEYNPLSSLWINPKILLVCVGAGVVTASSEVVVYPDSSLGHVGVGAASFLLVVFCLRWEIKPVVEKVFQLIEKLLFRTTSTTDMCSEDQFSRVPLINTVHRLLYK